MPYSIKKSLMLYLIIIIVIIFVYMFLVRKTLKFSNGFHSLHGPISQLPCFRPSYIHRFRPQNNDYYFKIIIPHRCAQAWSSIRRHSSFNSIDASLPQHQMCIVPLVCFAVSIRILFHYMLLCAHYFPELFYLHAFGCQLCDVECTCFVVIIWETVWTVVECILQVKGFCCFIHFFEEIEDLRVITKLASLLNIWTLFDIEGNIEIWLGSTRTRNHICVLQFLLAAGCFFGNSGIYPWSIDVTIFLVVQALVAWIVFLFGSFSFQCIIGFCCW